MSELHLSLIIIGLLFIAVVVAFNRWQERKYRKQAEKMFRGERQDVLFDDPSKKADFDDELGETPNAKQRSEPGERIEPAQRAEPEKPVEPGKRIEPGKRAEPEKPVEPGKRIEPGKRVEPGKRIEPGQRIEPGFGAAPAIASEETSPRHTEQFPPPAPPVSAKPVLKQAAAPASVQAEVQAAHLIDEAIDLIGALRLDQAVAANTVQGLVTRAQTFGKPMYWQGLDDGRWMDVQPGGRYSELKIALQLADRRGPATSADISRFIALIKQFAGELNGSAQAETEQSAAARATELDGFCADVDVEIGVNLVAREHAMPGTKVRALAEAAGMKLSAEGVFHLRDEHGASLFTLRNSEPRPLLPEHVKNITTRGITLLLDVPRVAHGERVFDQMLQLGRSMAHTLSGEVVDDNRKPLTDAGADSIRKQLGLIYRQMEGYGIPAGSALALRLFS